MFKTTIIGFNEVLQLPATGFVYLKDALVWQAFQDFLNLDDAEAATDWYNQAHLDGLGFRPSRYTIKVVKKGYEVTLHEEKSS